MKKRMQSYPIWLGGLLVIIASFTATADTTDILSGYRQTLSHQHPHSDDSGESDHAGAQAPAIWNMELLGREDFDGAGFHADVWAHSNHAYVGTWGIFGLACPAEGVKVVDISNPSAPTWIHTLPAPAFTQTNDVKVVAAKTEYFSGDLLAVSNEDCGFTGARGFQLFDVSDPENAQELGRFGPAVTDPTSLQQIFDFGFGIHNMFFFEANQRLYAAVVIDFAELLQLIFTGVSTTGDLRIIDVTDPSNPVEVADWGIVKNLGLDPFEEGQGDDFALAILHDVYVRKGIAYLSYWDAGLILLDVSDPANPRFISRTKYPATEEGNTHTAATTPSGRITIVGDEDFTAGPWGGLRIFDTSVPAAPQEIATFETANSASARQPGWYSAHNLDIRGDKLYVSWYADGIRVIDLEDPAEPEEIAYYVPESMPDPYGVAPPGVQMWGIYLHRSLVLGSDINGGLHVLRHNDED